VSVGVEVPNPGGGFGPLARVRSKWPGFSKSSNVAGTGFRSTRSFAVFPRSGGLMVIERFLEGRNRGGGPPLGQAGREPMAVGGTGRRRGSKAPADGRRLRSGVGETPCRDWSFGPRKGTAGGSIGAKNKGIRGLVTKIQSPGFPGWDWGLALARSHPVACFSADLNSSISLIPI
jgi:hypothetical protein